jgi:photosystem II stability/assembly factor-like uncharacterized protein
MKKEILIIILLASCSYLFAQNEKEWEYVNTINEWMNKVYVQGSDVVFVVGEKGLIAKSTDRAMTWSKQYFPTEVTLNDVIFCNDEIGFTVGNNGTILKTEDGGAHWAQITIETIQHINAIDAIGLDNIWVIGNGGLIMHSIDAGETWITENLLSDNRNLYDIKFQGNIGYIVGDSNSTLITEDGGSRWNTQIVYNNPYEYDKIFSLCLTENKAFAIVNSFFMGLGTIISTTDYHNWSILSGDIWAKRNFYFTNDNHGFIASYDWTTGGGFGLWMYKTIDAGETWREMNYKLPYYFPFGISEKSCFSFTENGELGYFLTGQLLMRTPYTGDFYVGLPNIKSDNSNLTVQQYGNEVQISSFSKNLSDIEILSLTGTIWIQKKSLSNEIKVNIGNLPKGVYLVRATFADKTRTVVKWIKQ